MKNRSQLVTSSVFWININDMDIEIDYYVYENDHITAFANYYYENEESITGKAIGKAVDTTIENAIIDLYDQHLIYGELDTESLVLMIQKQLMQPAKNN